MTYQQQYQQVPPNMNNSNFGATPVFITVTQPCANSPSGFVQMHFMVPQQALAQFLNQNSEFARAMQQSFEQAQQQQQQHLKTKPSVLEQLPTFPYTPNIALDCNTCSICQCDFEEAEELLQLTCGHTYHKQCILPWLQQHNTCANCRFELPVQDADHEKQRYSRMQQRFGTHGLQLLEYNAEVEHLHRMLLLNKLSARQVDNALMQVLLKCDCIESSDSSVCEQRKRLVHKIQHLLQQAVEKQ